MAEQSHSLETATPSPKLMIKVKWLEQLGFTTGQSVSITAENGCLIIRAGVSG